MYMVRSQVVNNYILSFYNFLDVDECDVGTDTCDDINGACANTEGSYTCSCNAEYALNADGSTCDSTLIKCV